MADLVVVVTEDGESWFLGDGSDETEEAALFGECLDFKDKRYMAETDGEHITLSVVTALPDDAFTEEAEGDEESEDDADDEEEGVASAAD